MSKFRARAVSIVALITVGTFCSISAFAGEPRPWLCRDKPVFSDSHPMQYQAAAKGGGDWQIFFMQFQLNAAHDGFSIRDSREMTKGGAVGTLPSGQYYAVALYRKGGVWVCSYGEEASPAPGTIKSLCYGPESGPDCMATLSVKPSTSP